MQNLIPRQTALILFERSRSPERTVTVKTDPPLTAKRWSARKSANLSIVDKRRDAAQQLAALRDQQLYKDVQINNYLKRTPVVEEHRKFGLPQDKYRWGFFGSKSMRYDVWGRSLDGR